MRIPIPSDDPTARQAIGASLGEALATCRRETGMSQAELAFHVGIGDEAISRVERGVAIPAYMRIHDFAAVLGCGLARLALQGSAAPSDEAALIEAELKTLNPAARKRVLRGLMDAARYERELTSRK